MDIHCFKMEWKTTIIIMFLGHFVGPVIVLWEYRNNGVPKQPPAPLMRLATLRELFCIIESVSTSTKLKLLGNMYPQTS